MAKADVSPSSPSTIKPEHQEIPAMTQPEADAQLSEFLATFDVAELGEGDMTAGANTFAAMAITLANLARPGSKLADSGGRTFDIGASVLVSGTFSPSLVTDRVVIELGVAQRNTNSHLRREALACEQEAKKRGGQGRLDDSMLGPGSHTSMIGALDGPGPSYEADREARMVRLSEEPAPPVLAELLMRSRVFLTGNGPAAVDKQLEYSHRCRPIIHLGIDKRGDFARWGGLIAAVIDGRATSAMMDESIRGTVLVTDPTGLLGDAVQAGDDSCHWLGRVLWLVDGEAGPEAPEACSRQTRPVLGALAQRYAAALGTAWGRRINFFTTAATIRPITVPIPQERWVAFLRGMEPEFPGITGAARNLLATLLFGMVELIDAEPVPKRFRWSIGWGEALARHLVVRMCNARRAMLWSRELARDLQLMESLVEKLADGPQRAAQLKRRFWRLPMAHCVALLHKLESYGRAVCIGDLWSLTTPSGRDQRCLTLDQ